MSDRHRRTVYRDLSHPAMGYLGIPEGVPSPIPAEVRNNPMPYAFRTADGSNYNVHMPTLGMAGLPYVRTVTGSNTFLQHRTYPPAEVIFDELLKRDEFVEHPGARVPCEDDGSAGARGGGVGRTGRCARPTAGR